MHFNSQVVCEFERETNKVNCLFVTLSLSSTVIQFKRPNQVYHCKDNDVRVCIIDDKNC